MPAASPWPGAGFCGQAPSARCRTVRDQEPQSQRGAGNHPARMMSGAPRLATVTTDDYWLNAQGWSHG